MTSSIPSKMPSISHSRLLTTVPTARVCKCGDEPSNRVYKTAAQAPHPGPTPQTEPSVNTRRLCDFTVEMNSAVALL